MAKAIDSSSLPPHFGVWLNWLCSAAGDQCVAIFQAGQKAVIEKLCKAVLGRGVWGAKPPTVHTFFPLKKMLLHVILGIFLNLMRKKKETKNV